MEFDKLIKRFYEIDNNQDNIINLFNDMNKYCKKENIKEDEKTRLYSLMSTLMLMCSKPDKLDLEIIDEFVIDLKDKPEQK